MNAKDIIVGTDYEYDDRLNMRVTLIEIGVKLEQYAFRGVRVRAMNGREWNAPTRLLLRPWAEKEETKARRDAEAIVRADLKERFAITAKGIRNVTAAMGMDLSVRLEGYARPGLIILAYEPEDAAMLLTALRKGWAAGVHEDQAPR